MKKQISKNNYKYLLISVIIFFGLFGLAEISRAANYYVRDGGTNTTTCSSWATTDSCDQLSTAENIATRGSTIYVADGSYSGVTFNTAESGTTIITVKKATATDHGTTTGWLSSYGDGVATFAGSLYFHTGYWTIDGVTGGGPGSWDNGHGFRISVQTDLGYISVARPDKYPPYLTFKHINIGPDAFGIPGSQTGIYAGGGRGGTNMTVQYCYIHHMSNVGLIVAGGNFLFEYNYLSYGGFMTDILEPPWYVENHGSGMALHAPNNNATIRYNLFGNNEGTGQLGVYYAGNYDAMKIYGNIFFIDDPERWGGECLYQTGIEATGPITNSKIYNNTFYNACDQSVIDWDRSTNTGNQFKNNIIYLVSTGYSTKGMIYDYNASPYYVGTPGEPVGDGAYDIHKQTLTSNPFVNAAGIDFSLSASTQAGLTLINETVNGLLHTYNKDMLGNTRGGDGVWDKGALEYVSGADDTTSPSPPTNVVVS